MKPIFRLLLIPSLFISDIAGAQIYKCENASGVVEYTDESCDHSKVVTLNRSNITEGLVPIEQVEGQKPGYSSTNWYKGAQGYHRALEKVETHEAPMILYFRVDWCPFCIAIENNLLNQRGAIEAMKPFVKVQIDPEKGAAERKIFEQMGGTGYPTFLAKPYQGRRSRITVTPRKSENSDKKYVSVSRFVKNIKPYAPEKPILTPISASDFHMLAKQEIKEGDLSKAQEHAKRAIELAPNTFSHYKLLDDILAPSRDWPQIIQYWTEYLALAPYDANALLERSGSHLRNGDTEAATRDAKAAADLGSTEGLRRYWELEKK